MFSFLRYDVTLELKWIEDKLNAEGEVDKRLGRKLTETDVVRMRALDDPTIIGDIYTIAQIAAEKQVKAEHWLGDLPEWTKGVKLPPARPRTSSTRPPPPPMSSWTKLATKLAVAMSHLRAKLARMTDPERGR
jgi:hypothetical protein